MLSPFAVSLKHDFVASAADKGLSDTAFMLG